MKHLILTLVLLLAVFAAVAQTVNNVATKIDEVTVYRNGALVTRSGKISLPKGESTFYLNSLSTELDPNTLRIGIANNSVKILSVKHEIEVIDNDKAQKQSTADDKRIEVLQDSITLFVSQLEILKGEEDLIKANQKIGGEQNGVSTAELKAMTEFYKNELGEIAAKKILVNHTIRNCRDQITKLMQAKQNRQKDLQKKDSRVKLVLQSDAPLSNVPVIMSYIIFNASWEPYYEIRVDAVNRPLDLVYGAHIKQESTEDWNSVRLTVSTGDPSIGNDAPEFEAMYLPPVRRQNNGKKWAPPSSNLVYGVVTDEQFEPLPGVNVLELGTDNGTITDIDGKFKLEMHNIKNNIAFQYIGFKDIITKSSDNMHIVLEEDEQSLNEVVVVGYGSARNSAFVRDVESYSAAPEAITYEEPVKNIPLQLSKSQTATEFKIELPYSVPSDGKVYDVSMLTYHIDADYRYVTMPRNFQDVFLLADLKNFSQYPLLKGNAYVYLDNVYQGECEIAPDFAADTLSVSVGRDKDIAVSRTSVKEFTSKKFIGSSVKVQKGFEITIKNNKSATVALEVTDQYPLPKYSDIKVLLTNNGGATVDSEKGRLTWRLTLAPQEKRVLRFSYEVKYPKSYSFTVE